MIGPLKYGGPWWIDYSCLFRKSGSSYDKLFPVWLSAFVFVCEAPVGVAATVLRDEPICSYKLLKHGRTQNEVTPGITQGFLEKKNW